MEVKINVDDAKFNELFEKEHDALTKEDMHKIFEECVREYFRRNEYEKIDRMLFEKDRWGSQIQTDYLKKMIANCDLSGLQDVIDICINELKENHFKLLKEVILDAIVSGFINNYTFHSNLKMAIQTILADMQQSTQ